MIDRCVDTKKKSKCFGLLEVMERNEMELKKLRETFK